MLIKHLWLVVLLVCAGYAGRAQADVLIRCHTPIGDMDIQLFNNDKPVTVSNFVKYVRRGFYNTEFLHRCAPGFVVQGGGYMVTNTALPDGISTLFRVPNFGYITNEFNVGRKISNTYGTLAMAKVGGYVNSASSQWFFNLADNSSNLDNQNGGFTVFGRVIGGTNVLDKFNHLADNGCGVVDLSAWYSWASDFKTLPMTRPATSIPAYTDLFYTTFELLEANISLNSLGERLVTWSSVSNRVNTVECADTLPPVWTSLYSAFGTGEKMTFTDSETGVARRFYRIKINY
jgi:cyclophilin family peptidyl-prolyl cis-trans isomerase